MPNLIFKHEDKRRIILEWIKDFPIRRCKVIVAKQDTELGNHYHKKNKDIIYLLSGKGWYKLGKGRFKLIKNVVTIPENVRHTFRLKKGAIVLEASTKPFDIKDEIK